MSVIDLVKSMLGSGDAAAEPGTIASPSTSTPPAPPTPAEPSLEITLSDPGPDTDTCKIVLNRDLSPDKTEFFETYAEAEGWPMVQLLMRVSGVHSVIVKGNLLIVAKHSGAEWSSLLQPIEHAIRVGLDPQHEDAEQDGLSPVDAIAAAAAGHGPEQDLRNRVQEILDNEINPSVAGHGGYISLLDVQGTRVFLHMGGGCQGCGMASATLKHGVEASLRAQIPEISEILDTTDHAAGANPYYQSGF
ncbi:MAG: NifU family protein [Deltaproteobacteria bacterium]|nr:NifU family protein [Deltaproteobacteria bacterium]MBW2389775.1 NifU family protein [Deltaproteobacteria bacterium]MBW2725928.1 NifU family protein [Deltaproteobacteria bacterium]